MRSMLAVVGAALAVTACSSSGSGSGSSHRAVIGSLTPDSFQAMCGTRLQPVVSSFPGAGGSPDLHKDQCTWDWPGDNGGQLYVVFRDFVDQEVRDEVAKGTVSSSLADAAGADKAYTFVAPSHPNSDYSADAAVFLGGSNVVTIEVDSNDGTLHFPTADQVRKLAVAIGGS